MHLKALFQKRKVEAKKIIAAWNAAHASHGVRVSWHPNPAHSGCVFTGISRSSAFMVGNDIPSIQVSWDPGFCANAIVDLRQIQVIEDK